MIGTGGFAEARHIGQRRQPGIAPAAQDLDALGDQRAVDAGQRHHVADGAERHEIEPAEQVWLGLRVLVVERSEEHTSELQSLMRISYAVFCLKKKKQTNNL